MPAKLNEEGARGRKAAWAPAQPLPPGAAAATTAATRGCCWLASATAAQYVLPSGGCGSLRLCGAAISRRSSVSTVSMV